MAKIVPKLNLNKTPQIVENASLVFAKNIKITKDGSIVRDDGIIEVTAINDILGVNNNQLVGYITYNTCIYLFIYSVVENNSAIYKYDERLNTCIALDTAWHYEGYVNNTCSTQVFGEAIVNLNSDVILIVSEKGNDSLMIPIKYINLNRTSSSDNESIYKMMENCLNNHDTEMTCPSYEELVEPNKIIDSPYQIVYNEKDYNDWWKKQDKTKEVYKKESDDLYIFNQWGYDSIDYFIYAYYKNQERWGMKENIIVKKENE